MIIEMSRETFDALPRRADLVNDPMPNQCYRDENGGIVRPWWVVTPLGGPGVRLQWEGFKVAIYD